MQKMLVVDRAGERHHCGNMRKREIEECSKEE